MDINGKGVKVWVNEHTKRDGGKWYDYNVSVNKKLPESGEYKSAYVKVRFGRDVYVPEKLPNGAKMDFEGYLTVDFFVDKDGREVKKPMIMVTTAKFPELYDEAADDYAEVDDSIPF
jgi:hypothetical protein